MIGENRKTTALWRDAATTEQAFCRVLGLFITAAAGETVLALNSQRVFEPFFGDSHRMEIVSTITQENDGGYVAECLSRDIFTRGNTGEELRANVREAVTDFFFDQPKPTAVRLHLVRDELLTGA